MKKEKEGVRQSVVFHSEMFDDRTGCISIDGNEEVYMENRLKEFFSVLLNHKNTVLTREELMSFVWKDIIVSEESISKAVSDLRRFFQANNFANLKIITVNKVGYKLEIDEGLVDLNRRSYNLKLGLRILAYVILGVILLVIIIRALRYDQ